MYINDHHNIPEPPSAPQGPVRTHNLTAQSAEITWSPPADIGGAPISNYIIEMRRVCKLSLNCILIFKPTCSEMETDEGL